MAGYIRYQQPLSGLVPSIIHLLQTVGAHVIFIGRLIGRVMRTDDRLVPTILRTGLRGLVDDKLCEEEDKNPTAKYLWPFGKSTLGAQQIGAQHGTMGSSGAAEEGEERSSREDLSWL